MMGQKRQLFMVMMLVIWVLNRLPVMQRDKLPPGKWGGCGSLVFNIMMNQYRNPDPLAHFAIRKHERKDNEHMDESTNHVQM